jgi:hypothetical protein
VLALRQVTVLAQSLDPLLVKLWVVWSEFALEIESVRLSALGLGIQ